MGKSLSAVGRMKEAKGRETGREWDGNGSEGRRENIPTALGAPLFSNFPFLTVSFSIICSGKAVLWKE